MKQKSDQKHNNNHHKHFFEDVTSFVQKSRKIGRMELIEEKHYKLLKGEKRYKVQPNLDSRTVLRNIIDRKLCADDRAISIYLSIH